MLMRKLTMNHYITKDDYFGIRKAVRVIFKKARPLEGDFGFNVLFNQVIPRVWVESYESVLRHAEEIRKLVEEFKPSQVWIERGGRLKCVEMTGDLKVALEKGKIRLPTYLEIEKAKTRWQQKPTYRKEEGFSQPIAEEYVQMKIYRKEVK